MSNFTFPKVIKLKFLYSLCHKVTLRKKLTTFEQIKQQKFHFCLTKTYRVTVLLNFSNFQHFLALQMCFSVFNFCCNVWYWFSVLQSAVQSNEDVRLLRVRDVVRQLPPPHFRTLQYLLCHLAKIASHGEETGMTPKNIAIVWAPNLLR